jgi:hypothetical protein
LNERYGVDHIIRTSKEKGLSLEYKRPLGVYIKIFRNNVYSQKYFVQFNKKEGYLRLKDRFVDVIRNLHPDLRKDKEFSSKRIRLWIKKEKNHDHMFEKA